MNVQYRKLYPKDWDWVQQHLPHPMVADVKGIVAVDLDEDELVGACVLDNWTFNSVQSHLIILNSLLLRHGFLEEIAEYIFVTCERGIVYGLVPSNNHKALKTNRHVGFTEKIRLKDAVMDGCDMVIMELRKEDCRFLPEPLREAS